MMVSLMVKPRPDIAAGMRVAWGVRQSGKGRGEMGQITEIRFDPGPLGLDEITRLALDMWSDIGFDEAALGRLRRDGLALDGVRLRGASPYLIDSPDGRMIRVRVENGAPAETMLDLWKLHFARRLRGGTLAA